MDDIHLHESRSAAISRRRLFAPVRSNGPSQAWQHKLALALLEAPDHPDAHLARRLGEMFGQGRDEIEHMIDEAETDAMKVALREALSIADDLFADATVPARCVLGAWDDERDARRHGDRLDQRRA